VRPESRAELEGCNDARVMTELTRRDRRLHRRNRRAAIGSLVVVLALAAAAVIVTRDSNDKSALSASSETTTTGPSSASATAVTSPAPGTSYIATAQVADISVYDAPDAPTPAKSFKNPWFVNDDPKLPVPLVFSVQQQDADGWIEVLLPTRPNGSTGWVHTADVALSTTRYHITVELGAHRLQVFNGDSVMLESAVAVGAPATPTPTGAYYIVALLKAPNPKTVYGPYAYGLSGHSEVLESFAGGDAEVGIHGNNDDSVLGKDVSHGCVRMTNDGITQLAGVLPLGTPVSITA
jgi:lipoprotein-anchoring transpeptidase ErfK/SrfK